MDHWTETAYANLLKQQPVPTGELVAAMGYREIATLAGHDPDKPHDATLSYESVRRILCLRLDRDVFLVRVEDERAAIEAVIRTMPGKSAITVSYEDGDFKVNDPILDIARAG